MPATLLPARATRGAQELHLYLDQPQIGGSDLGYRIVAHPFGIQHHQVVFGAAAYHHRTLQPGAAKGCNRERAGDAFHSAAND